MWPIVSLVSSLPRLSLCLSLSLSSWQKRLTTRPVSDSTRQASSLLFIPKGRCDLAFRFVDVRPWFYLNLQATKITQLQQRTFAWMALEKCGSILSIIAYAGRVFKLQVWKGRDVTCWIACSAGVFRVGETLFVLVNVVAAIFDFMTVEDWGE